MANLREKCGSDKADMATEGVARVQNQSSGVPLRPVREPQPSSRSAVRRGRDSSIYQKRRQLAQTGVKRHMLNADEPDLGKLPWYEGMLKLASVPLLSDYLRVDDMVVCVLSSYWSLDSCAVKDFLGVCYSSNNFSYELSLFYEQWPIVGEACDDLPVKQVSDPASEPFVCDAAGTAEPVDVTTKDITVVPESEKKYTIDKEALNRNCACCSKFLKAYFPSLKNKHLALLADYYAEGARLYPQGVVQKERPIPCTVAVTPTSEPEVIPVTAPVLSDTESPVKPKLEDIQDSLDPEQLNELQASLDISNALGMIDDFDFGLDL